MKRKLIDRDLLRDLVDKSTQVVNWYAHTAEVRGPFGRWFTCEGGSNGMGDEVKYPTPVASISDDCRFAAAAMSNLEPLLDELDKKDQKIAELQFELILMGRHIEEEDVIKQDPSA